MTQQPNYQLMKESGPPQGGSGYYRDQLTDALDLALKQGRRLTEQIVVPAGLTGVSALQDKEWLSSEKNPFSDNKAEDVYGQFLKMTGGGA
jgi:hypothetical protein